jgi:RNA polymerase sigma factor (sigma-70 family)
MMMRKPRRSDDELLDAVRGGDAEAFGTIFERYYGVILAYLARRTRDPEVAADLCGEVFARALLALHEQRANPGSAPAWLLTIARNALIDSVRRGQVEARARRQLGIERLAITDADVDCVERSSADDVLGALIEELPEAQRIALRARILDERDYPEIAADLGCSDLVVRQRVSRALKTLRSRLETTTQ